MKVLVRAPFSRKGLDALKEMFGEVSYDPWDETGEWFEDERTLELLWKEQPDIFITELDRVREKTLNGYGRLKVLGVCRANPANVDMDGCGAKHLPVLCTPARNAQAVAESAVGMLLCFMRHLHEAAQWEKSGKWGGGKTPYYLFRGNEIQGKRIGFVGFGAAGRAAAKLLKGFETEILFYDPFVKAAKGYRKAELEEVFETCDILSIHLPINQTTRRMIGKDLIGKMKKEAIFLNTSRSAVVDMEALNQALRENRIKGAILDVLDHEPPTEKELELWKLENVLLTPHICGASYEVADHHSAIMIRQLKEWSDKEAGKQVGEQADKQAGKETGKEADKQADKQAENKQKNKGGAEQSTGFDRKI